MTLNDEFITHQNTSYNTIKFTSEIPDKEVPFLDISIYMYVRESYLATILYTKPPDTCNLMMTLNIFLISKTP